MTVLIASPEDELQELHKEEEKFILDIVINKITIEEKIEKNMTKRRTRG